MNLSAGSIASPKKIDGLLFAASSLLLSACSFSGQKFEESALPIAVVETSSTLQISDQTLTPELRTAILNKLQEFSDRFASTVKLQAALVDLPLHLVVAPIGSKEDGPKIAGTCTPDGRVSLNEAEMQRCFQELRGLGLDLETSIDLCALAFVPTLAHELQHLENHLASAEIIGEALSICHQQGELLCFLSGQLSAFEVLSYVHTRHEGVPVKSVHLYDMLISNSFMYLRYGELGLERFVSDTYSYPLLRSDAALTFVANSLTGPSEKDELLRIKVNTDHALREALADLFDVRLQQRVSEIALAIKSE